MMRNDANIDFIIKGEGEVSFTDLCDAIEASKLTKFRRIDGLSYRKDEKLIENKKANLSFKEACLFCFIK